jgi:hypothetical protein
MEIQNKEGEKEEDAEADLELKQLEPSHKRRKLDNSQLTKMLPKSINYLDTGILE